MDELTSRTTMPHPKRNISSPPSPTSALSPPTTPPASPNPRAKKVARNKDGGTCKSKKPKTKTAKAKSNTNTTSKATKSLRECAKEALQLIGSVQVSLGVRVEETGVDRFRDSETAIGIRRDDDVPESPLPEQELKPELELELPSTTLPPPSHTRPASNTPRPVWDGRALNPTAEEKPPNKETKTIAFNLRSLTQRLAESTPPKPVRGSLRRGATFGSSRETRKVGVFVSSVQSSDTSQDVRRKKLSHGQTFGKPATFSVITKKHPLSLSVSGETSDAQMRLTKLAKETETASKLLKASKARQDARARVVSARAKAEDEFGKRHARVRSSFGDTESEGFRKTPLPANQRPNSALPVANQHASTHARAKELLSRRSEFSEKLLVREKNANEKRPTMAYGELCPLNLQSEKGKFLTSWSLYKAQESLGNKSGDANTKLPADPVFQYADPEAARVAMRRWGVASDAYLAEATEIMKKKKEKFPTTRTCLDDVCDVDVNDGSDVDEEDYGATRANDSSDTSLDDDKTSYAHHCWGPKVGPEALLESAMRYLHKHGVSDLVDIRWHKNLTAPSMTTTNSRDSLTGQLVCRGTLHLPELPPDASSQSRCVSKYRVKWIDALLDHEIGTHFCIAVNDAANGDSLRDAGCVFGGCATIDDPRRRAYTSATNFPKATSRGYGPRGPASPRERLVTEEGLACLNTHKNSSTKILHGPALAYFTRWHASKMGFSELFAFLEPHVPRVAQRWSACVRSKRGLTNASEKTAACAKDQSYFEGAVRILRARKLLDFSILHGGKVSLEEYVDAKNARRRFSMRRGKILRKVSRGAGGGTVFSNASFPECGINSETLEHQNKGYLAPIQGGVSSTATAESLRDATREARLKTQGEPARTFVPHFLEDETKYLHELDLIAEANGVFAVDDVQTRSMTGWAPRRGSGRVGSARRHGGGNLSGEEDDVSSEE